MSDNITARQALIMWCLLGRHGWAFQRDILPEVDRKDREALVAAGYITSTMINRTLLLKVEDRGWHWASTHLEAKLPPAMVVLQNWLGRLHDFLARSGGTLADFVGPAPETPPEPATRKPRARVRKPVPPKPPKPPRPLSPTALRKRIEVAYLLVTGGRKAEQALLSELRLKLADVNRDALDAGLLRILQGDKEGKKKARLGQLNDSKALTQSVREAAFSPGGEPYHLLWIQS